MPVKLYPHYQFSPHRCGEDGHAEGGCDRMRWKQPNEKEEEAAVYNKNQNSSYVVAHLPLTACKMTNVELTSSTICPPH